MKLEHPISSFPFQHTFNRALLVAGCLACFCGFGSGCGNNGSIDEKPQIAGVDGTKALDRVAEFIKITPRHSGSEGAGIAAEYIRDELLKIGLSPEIDEFIDATPIGEIVFKNVTAEIRGTGSDWIIIGSHYDTMSGISDDFAGANDSGSSTGLLIELAEILSARIFPKTNFLLAFFDGEECMVSYGPNDGLHGSKRLASLLKTSGRSKDVRAAIIIDMIGDRDLNVAIPQNTTPALVSAVFKAAHETGKRNHFSLGKTAVIDDHTPFLKAGMPAVLLIDFHFGSAPGKNDYWHTTEDTLDKLSAESLKTVGDVVLRTIGILTRISHKKSAASTHLTPYKALCSNGDLDVF